MRSEQRRGVNQRSSADARAGNHQHIVEWVDALNPEAPQRRCPQVAPHIPGRAGQFLIRKPPAGLDHKHPVTLLGESQGRDTPCRNRIRSR